MGENLERLRQAARASEAETRQTGDVGARKRRRKASGDRWACLNAFVEETLRDLTPAEVATWLVVFRVERKGRARVSYTSLAELTGRTERAVKTAVRLLIDKGLLRVLEKGGPDGSSNTYRVHPVVK